jgi:2-iminobutanoate/2-iminopropanoate deaminase
MRDAMKSSATLSGAAILLFAIGAAFAKPPASPEFLDSGKVYPANVPLTEAVRIDNTLLLSGQIGIQPGTLKLVAGGLKAETKQTMENIKTTLEAHGYAMRDLVKCTVMLADIAKWGEFNDIYKTYFSERFPARSALGVTGLALGAQVEVDCIAYRVRN